jgi:lipopolysaccharide transport system ATP-binding protein
MFLEHGVVRDVGFTSGVIAAYLRKAPSERRSVASYDRQPVGSGSHVIKAIVPISHEFQPRKIVEFSITVKQRSHDSPFFLCLHIKDQTEREIFVVASEYLKSGLLRPGDQELKLSINTPWLAPGTYSVDGTLYSAGIIDLYRDACQFEISPNVANDEYSATSAKNAGPILASFSLNIAVQQIGGDSASFTAK